MSIMPPDIEEVLDLVSEATVLVGGQPLHVMGYRPNSPLAEPEVAFQYGVACREIAVGSPAAARAYAMSILRAADAAEGAGVTS
jgi:hypothetical protein